MFRGSGFGFHHDTEVGPKLSDEHCRVPLVVCPEGCPFQYFVDCLQTPHGEVQMLTHTWLMIPYRRYRRDSNGILDFQRLLSGASRDVIRAEFSVDRDQVRGIG